MESLRTSSFGDLLRTIRKSRRLTQQALADRLGVHCNTIGIWERGEYLPESKTVVLEIVHQLDLDEQEARQLLEASLTALTTYWSVPFPRNPFFTGREELLERLHQQLRPDSQTATTRSYALYGLGGVGKTQVALEYAYRYAIDYTAVFWLGAETMESIAHGFLQIAEQLLLPEYQGMDQARIIAAVQRWLLQHRGWLLIWDNVENLELLASFLPPTQHSAILLTTHHQTLGTLAQRIEVQPMGREEGMLFTLRRARVIEGDMFREQMQLFTRRFPNQYAATAELVKIMGGLPLALDQAGSYIDETQCRVSEYLQLFAYHPTLLLSRRGIAGNDHSRSVTTTLALAYAQVKHRNPLAAELLCLCAFLAPDAIPENLLTLHLSAPICGLSREAVDTLQEDLALAVLHTFSLIRREAKTRTFSLHRLVQMVIQGEMDEQERGWWQQRVITLLNRAFPEVSSAVWGQCEQLLPHVLASIAMLSAPSASEELANVLRKAADYLLDRGQYEQAEPLYERALQISRHILGPEDPRVASPLNGLAHLALKQGKYQQAEQLFQEALCLNEQAQHPDHLQMATTLNGWARLSLHLGQYAEAERLFERALHLREESLGPEHPLVVIVLEGLALLFFQQKHHAQAEAIYERVLAILEQNFGSAHPLLTRSLGNQAYVYKEQGKYEQAEQLYQRALYLCSQVPEPENAGSVFTCHNSLANLYLSLGAYGQAEPLWLFQLADAAGLSRTPG